MAFLSHGTPLMSITESESSSWWQQFGAEVLASEEVRGIVIIDSHWTELDDKIRVGTNVSPVVDLGSLIPREKYAQFKPNVSPELARRVVSLLKSAGFNDVDEAHNATWVDAPTTPSLWMFRENTPPITTLSLNARYDPVFHVRMGRALRSLREEGILIMASGCIVHNIFRANPIPVALKRDSLQKGSIPAKWATKFEQSVYDVIASNTGSELAGALVRLTQSPHYLDAHPSNDHYYPLLVLAGAFYDNEEVYGRQMARTTEMRNIINCQYLWGDFGKKDGGIASPAIVVS